jgi:hypothetical protein
VGAIAMAHSEDKSNDPFKKSEHCISVENAFPKNAQALFMA